MGLKIIIAAGGSGGHIFPAIALGRAIRAKDNDADILYIGSDKSLDKRIFEKEGVNFFVLSANKLPYRPSVALIPFFAKLFSDVWRSLVILSAQKPDVVVGFGGYISFPVLLAARLKGIRSVIHEQNVVPGRANSVLFRFADRIVLSFEETRPYLGRNAAKAAFIGNPIRTERFKDDRSWGIRRFGLDINKFTVLVIGGSQGSHALNRTFIDSLFSLHPSVRRSLQVIHITGVKDYEWAISAYSETGIDYRVHSFVDRIEEAYSASDLVVTRSGASAIFELAFLGKPMILIPYPFAMSHQTENALVFSRKGAAVHIDEKDLSAESFARAIEGLFNDRKALKNLGQAARQLAIPGASELMAQEVFKVKKI
ncbi:MAG: undecaprenyldiphospho-muramoylpentapeptide beta-N-acetylglucosaminyltransferase [Candidatus Omnitrophica bacterium]|nr:undecaprenyldiphospho-muramoylpentapeptide beta-N-acetylglucosaminyltransferase [Candidatus Omnitrophota bacterium]MCM8790700.1 undecaprenyldiphospho-muramoylpentapeptide beta-N-acetylglucosaminyltransferase [Candidatus Omnitrophota bacterium]